MKCYIATYYRYNNYGTRLQNFALCYTLRRLGIVPVTLSIRSLHKPYNRFERKKMKIFESFNKALSLKKYSKEKLRKINFNDAFTVAGSDQIWSPAHLSRHPEDRALFFLEFAPREKRYAFSPSFGVKEIPQNMSDLYKDALNGFRELSVREEAGKKIIHNLIAKDVPIMPDPTMLLTADEWRGIADYKKNPKDNYIVTYFLGAHEKRTFDDITKYAEENDLQIINIAGNKLKRNDIIASPYEFLGLIDRAEKVFTDSFHATLFAKMFGTDFSVYERSDVKQFSRIETLLKMHDFEEARKAGIIYLKGIINDEKTKH